MHHIRNLIVLLLIASTSLAQKDDNITTADKLLLDGNFTEVIRMVDAAPGKAATVPLLCRKAEALIRLTNYDQAITLLKELEIKAAPDLFSHAVVLTKYGSLYTTQSRYELGLNDLQKALTEFNKDNKTNTLEAAEAIALTGNIYRSTGKYVQADEQLQMALNIRKKILPENHELIAATYNDLGLVFAQSEPEKAFTYYEKALEIYEHVHGTDHPKIAIANTNLGVLNRSEKLYGDAITYFEKALTIWEKIYPQPHPNKALVYMNMGQTYSVMGNQKAALEFYEKARVMYESSLGKKHPDVAYIYNLLGNEKLAQNKYDQSLHYYQQALIANNADFNTTTITSNPPTKAFYNGNQLLYSLMYKSHALEAKYFGYTLSDTDLALSIHTLQVADTLIDRLRQQITNESDKIALGSIANEVYADGARIAFTLSEVALKKRDFWRALSFYFAEKSKSAVLLEAISDTDAKEFANIPASLLEQEKSIKSDIALITQKLAQKPTEEEERKLREKLYTQNRLYESFTKKLESEFPDYYNLKYNTTSPSIEQIQNLLPKGTALMSYFIDEKNSRLYTYVILRNKFLINDKALPDRFDKLITGLRNSLYFTEINTFKTSAYALHEILIPKLPRSVTDLVILPTGRLSVIPFESLVSRNPKSESDYRKLRYLIQKYTVRYEFSAGLVLQKKKETSTHAITSALFCAPIHFDETENLFDLPGTEIEVNAIVKVFDEKGLTSKVLVQNNATELTLKSTPLQDYSIVHFATHGIVDERSPELSRIYLQKSTKEDGKLYSGEIYNLQLNADLVTLSACQTGLGKISKGEGVIGLSRALVYAGAKNLIVSFWSVADESTSLLMTDFYHHLLERQGMNYTQSLRTSKLKMMEGMYAAPYYWAPFILIGF